MYSLVSKSLLKSVVKAQKQFGRAHETSDNYSKYKTLMNVRASGSMIADGEQMKPVTMSFLAFETIRPSMISNKCPVILIHEIMDSKTHWREFAKRFYRETKRKVFAIDARNHGESEHDKNMSCLHMAEDIKTFMKEMKLGKCCVVGHGMGGQAAMVLALTHPSLVDQLVVVDASPMSMSTTHAHLSRNIEALTRVQINKRLTLAAAQETMYYKLATEIPERLLRYVLTQNIVLVDDEGKRFFKWRINLLSIAANMQSIIKFTVINDKTGCQIPVLFIYGEKTVQLKGKERLDIRKIFPNSTVVYVPKAGHWPHVQNPEHFLTSILEFTSME